MNGAHERLTLVDIGRRQLGLSRRSRSAGSAAGSSPNPTFSERSTGQELRPQLGRVRPGGF